MAIWQLRTWVVPARACGDADGPPLARQLSSGSFNPWVDSAAGWAGAKASLIGLPRGTSWSSEILLWGTEESHCLEELLEAGRLKEIILRIDARVMTRGWCTQLAQFLSALEASLVTQGEGRVITTETEVVETLQRSSAWRFVQNPQAFLRGLLPN